MEEILGTVLGLMLMHVPPPMVQPYQPPMVIQQPQPPLPPGGRERSHLVTHNGSLMTLTVWPDKSIQIAYAQPKDSLLAVGVRPGTVLVRGQWRDDRTFAGVAHVFYCGGLPYAVTGRVDEGGALALEGPAPRVYVGTCQVSDYVWTHNSHLRFDRLPDGVAAADEHD